MSAQTQPLRPNHSDPTTQTQPGQLHDNETSSLKSPPTSPGLTAGRKGACRLRAVALGFVLFIGLPVTVIVMVVCRFADDDFWTPFRCVIFLWNDSIKEWLRVRAFVRDSLRAKHSDDEIANGLVKLLSEFDPSTALVILSNTHYELLYRIVQCSDRWELELLELFEKLARCDSGRFVRVLERKDGSGETFLHHVALRDSLDRVLTCYNILKSVPASKMRSLIGIKNNRGNTFLHVLAQRGRCSAEILEVIQQRDLPLHEICSIVNNKSQTILHCIADKESPYSSAHFELLLEKLGNEIKPMTIEDEDGNTPLHIVLKKHGQHNSLIMLVDNTVSHFPWIGGIGNKKGVTIGKLLESLEARLCHLQNSKP